MKLFKSVAFIMLITLIALIYVHQQVELVKLSYTIDSKERRLKDILDHNETLGYNIKNLEAPSRLEGVLLAQKIDIAFPKRDHVVRVARLNRVAKNGESIRAAGLERKVNIFGIFDFFSPAREAQAREK